MSDISMCFNENCIDKLSCHRFTATVNGRWQSMILIAGEKSKDTCDMFWDNEGYMKDPKRFNEDASLK